MKRLVALTLALTLLLSLTACDSKPAEPTEPAIYVPEDFSFSLTWGVCGDSSYDSKTGKLVKDAKAAKPEDYTTCHTLTPEEESQIYALLQTLDPASYPDRYDPQTVRSKPSITFILSVRAYGSEKTIHAAGIDPWPEAKAADEKGQLFLDTCWAIYKLLTATEEWQALPDYETYYE